MKHIACFVCDGDRPVGMAVCVHKSKDCRSALILCLASCTLADPFLRPCLNKTSGVVFITPAHVMNMNAFCYGLLLKTPEGVLGVPRLFSEVDGIFAVQGNEGEALTRFDACALVLEVDSVFPQLEGLEVLPVPEEGDHPSLFLEWQPVHLDLFRPSLPTMGSLRDAPSAFSQRGAFVVGQCAGDFSQVLSGTPVLLLPRPKETSVCCKAPEWAALKQVPRLLGMAVGLDEDGNLIAQPVCLALRNLVVQVLQGELEESEARAKLSESPAFDDPHVPMVFQFLSPPHERMGFDYLRHPGEVPILALSQAFRSRGLGEGGSLFKIIPWTQGQPPVVKDVRTEDRCEVAKIVERNVIGQAGGEKSLLEVMVGRMEASSYSNGIDLSGMSDYEMAAFKRWHLFFPGWPRYWRPVSRSVQQQCAARVEVRPDLKAGSRGGDNLACKALFHGKYKDTLNGTRVLLDPVMCQQDNPRGGVTFFHCVWITNCHYGDDDPEVDREWRRLIIEAEHPWLLARERTARLDREAGERGGCQESPGGRKVRQEGRRRGSSSRSREDERRRRAESPRGYRRLVFQEELQRAQEELLEQITEKTGKIPRADKDRDKKFVRDLILSRILGEIPPGLPEDMKSDSEYGEASSSSNQSSAPWYPFELLGWLVKDGDSWELEPPSWILCDIEALPGEVSGPSASSH